MKIRKWTMPLVQVCAAFLIPGLHAPLHAAAISIISSSVVVQGKAGETCYAGLHSGSSTGTTGDGSIWEAASSGSITSTRVTLNAISRMLTGAGDDWWNAGYSEVCMTSRFKPLSRNITFNFTGSTGYHAFESWIDYTLTDLTAATPFQSASWRYESDWVTDSLPYTANLVLNVDHEYELLLLAKSTIGDSREGFANLELQIVPEPASAALLGIGLAGMIFRRSRKPV